MRARLADLQKIEGALQGLVERCCATSRRKPQPPALQMQVPEPANTDLPGDLPPASQIDQSLLVALTRAFYWQQLLDDGVVASGSEIAQREGLHHSTVNELLRLTLLWFQRNPVPTDWVAQRELVAGFDA